MAEDKAWLVETHPWDIFDAKSNWHCTECRYLGGNVARYLLVYRLQGSPHVWRVAFPCMDARSEWYRAFEPFIAEYAYARIERRQDGEAQAPN